MRILGWGFGLDSGKDSSVEDPGEDSRVDYWGRFWKDLFVQASGEDSGADCRVGVESVDFPLFLQ